MVTILWYFIAISICKNCKVFTCEISGCGSEHLFHDFDNIQSWLRSEVKPALDNINLDAITEENPLIKEIKAYRTNIEKFIIEKKRQCDSSKKKIVDLLEDIYSNSLDEINEFGFETTKKLEEFADYINRTHKGIYIYLFKITREWESNN